MKNSLVLLAVFGIFAIMGAKASRSTQNVNCVGPNDQCNPERNNINTFHTNIARRSLRDLFVRENLHDRALARAAAGPAQGAAQSGGAKSRPITVDQIVGMITSNQRLPDALQGPVVQKAKSMGLNPPDPAKQAPTPPQLAGHPATHALEKLNRNDIPVEILNAAKTKWGSATHRRDAEPIYFEDTYFANFERDSEPEAYDELYEHDL